MRQKTIKIKKEKALTNSMAKHIFIKVGFVILSSSFR